MAGKADWSFTGTGNGTSVRAPKGLSDLRMAGGVGSIRWEVSYDREAAVSDAAATWDTLAADGLGAKAIYALNSDSLVQKFNNTREDLWIRPVCSAYTSGTIAAGLR